MTRNLPSDLYLPPDPDERVNLYYQMVNLDFGGYTDQIQNVVARTLDNSPRTAHCVREILTPRVRSSRRSSSYSPTSTTTSVTSWGSDNDTLESSFTPRPAGVGDLGPFEPVTPRYTALETIMEQSGSEETGYETRRTPRPLPYPKTAGTPYTPRTPGAPYTPRTPRPAQTPRTPKSGKSLPGRKENGVHIPYLELPVTSRSNTLVNVNDLLSTLMSTYKSSQPSLQGSLAQSGPYIGPTPPAETAWTKKERMLCVGVVALCVIVLLLLVVVVLVAVGVANGQGDNQVTWLTSRNASESVTHPATPV